MVSRREILSSSVLLGSVGALLGARRARASDASGGYGPLAPVADLETGLELLKLPAGFTYRSLGWTGEPMADDTPTPDRHDGMGVVRRLDRRGHEFVVIRNHERGAAARIGASQTPTYDDFAQPPLVPGLGGGTTALMISRGRLERTIPALAGTAINCAGGVTPWGSWLTCEEVIVRGGQIGARDHGFVFEVPSPDLAASTAAPIVDMGLMIHEAVAVDPRSGYVYLTEDNGPSGFYRFRPDDRSARSGALARGGRLEMLKIRGADNADLGTAVQGEMHDVEWVEIDEPNADPERFQAQLPGLPAIFGAGRSGPYLQGESRGGAAFRRLEGCWQERGLIYFTDTTGGPAGAGSLWALDPGDETGAGALLCVFASPGELTADHVDNVCVSPRGGILLCEDGGGVSGAEGLAHGTRLVGLTAERAAYAFAENNMLVHGPIPDRPWITPRDYRRQEFAGCCFSPRGDYLLVNIQTPGVTFAITGPWESGAL